MHKFILIENLKDRLKKFDSPPELISITINTLSKVSSNIKSSIIVPYVDI